MALNSHDMSWNSFFVYLYNLSPANRISFKLLTFHMLVQILFCTAFTKNTKQHGRHCHPLESGLNISSPWWILPCNNTDAFSCRFIWFDGPGFCSISIFSHLLTTSGFIQYWIYIQGQGFVRKFTIPWKTTNMNTLYYMLSLSISQNQSDGNAFYLF